MRLATRRRTTRHGLVLRALAAGILILGPALPAFAAPLRIGGEVPVFSLPDLDGTRVSVPGGFAGKILVLHFWASWCPSCIDEMEALDSLRERMSDRGFVPLSINVGEKRAAVDEYIRPLEIGYTILLDADRAVARDYGVTGLPMTFILDRKGKIRYKILGEINREGLRKLIGTIP